MAVRPTKVHLAFPIFSTVSLIDRPLSPVDFIKNSELMIRQSVWSSLIAAKLASKFLNENGLLSLTGAKAALEPTPGK